jgi:hypothetical protein
MYNFEKECQNNVKGKNKVSNTTKKKTNSSFLNDLSGQWYLERTYDNGSKVIGTANVVKKTNSEYEYSEEGVMTLSDGKSLVCSRKYIYKPIPNGFAIYFFETPSKLFQNVVLKNNNGTLCAQATHFCVNDIYASSYSFFPDGHFEITHVVRGPKKTYTSKAIFSKNKV